MLVWFVACGFPKVPSSCCLVAPVPALGDGHPWFRAGRLCGRPGNPGTALKKRPLNSAGWTTVGTKSWETNGKVRNTVGKLPRPFSVERRNNLPRNFFFFQFYLL